MLSSVFFNKNNVYGFWGDEQLGEFSLAQPFSIAHIDYTSSKWREKCANFYRRCSDTKTTKNRLMLICIVVFRKNAEGEKCC